MKQIYKIKTTVRIYRASKGNMSGDIFLLGDYKVETRLLQLKGRIVHPYGNGVASPYLDPDPTKLWVTTIEGRDYIVQNDESNLPRIVIEPEPLSDEGLTIPSKTELPET